MVCSYFTTQSVMETCLTMNCRHPTQTNEDFEYVPLLIPLSQMRTRVHIFLLQVN